MRFARTFVLAFPSLPLTVFLAQPARPRGGQTATTRFIGCHLPSKGWTSVQPGGTHATILP